MREQLIQCSDRIILSCQCGERVVLIGRAVDWYDEEHLEFSCECGQTLTLGDSLPVETVDWTVFKSLQS